MTVYVARLMDYGLFLGAPGKEEWSQLFADTEEELHQFAEEIQLPRTWFMNKGGGEGWHYAMTPVFEFRARKHGAKVISREDVTELIIGQAMKRNMNMIRNMAPESQRIPLHEPELPESTAIRGPRGKRGRPIRSKDPRGSHPTRRSWWQKPRR